ncbi:MAG: TetR/AcrR family transcriptional regulator [Actinomycetes bacterium]
MTITGAKPSGRLPKSERRTQVLSSALEVFVDAGYHATGMDDIAERAGVSKPVLYQHFTSKLDLYLALLDAGIDELHASYAAGLRSTSDNKVRVQRTVQAYFEFVEDPQGAYRLVFESDLINEPAVRERVDQADLAVAQAIAHIITEDTGLSPQQALLLGSGMLGMSQVAARRWLRHARTDISREEAAELIASLGWRGISGFPLSHPPEE